MFSKLKSLISGFNKPDLTKEQIRHNYYLGAKEGAVDSMFCYGFLCLSDSGGPKNLGHAEYWLNLAANEGSKDAQFYLGIFYYEGEHFEKDEEKGVYWISIAAANGHKEAEDYFDIDI
jgi:TPR repeat protein